jgi:hypothetical protein
MLVKVHKVMMEHKVLKDTRDKTELMLVKVLKVLKDIKVLLVVQVPKVLLVGQVPKVLMVTQMFN